MSYLLKEDTLKAIKIAAYRHFLSGIPVDDDYQVEEAIRELDGCLQNDSEGHGLSIWQPFEQYSVGELVDAAESLERVMIELCEKAVRQRSGAIFANLVNETKALGEEDKPSLYEPGIHYGAVPPDTSPRWEEIDDGVWRKHRGPLAPDFYERFAKAIVDFDETLPVKD